MKKPTSAFFIVNYDLYPYDIAVSFGQTNEQIAKCLYKNFPKEDHKALENIINSKTIGKCTMVPSGITVIRIKELPRVSFDFGVLAHEIFHAVEFLMERIGMQYDINFSSEAYAYAIQYLTEKIYKKLGKFY